MRYFEVYKSGNAEELNRDDFDGAVWSDAYETAYVELVNEGAIRYWGVDVEPTQEEYDALGKRAEAVFDDIVATAWVNGYNSTNCNEMCLYIMPDDVTVDDMRGKWHD